MQGLADYNWLAKVSPWPVFVNKVLLEHTHILIYVLFLAAYIYNGEVK